MRREEREEVESGKEERWEKWREKEGAEKEARAIAVSSELERREKRESDS